MVAMPKPQKRARGEIELLPSGSRRVRVYAGIDPVSRKRNYLIETIPPGPNAEREAERMRTRLLHQVDQGRNPKTKATVNQLMDRYLEVLAVEQTTRVTYEGYINNHIRPLLGTLQLSKVGGEAIDSFYALLRTCRAHCHGNKRKHTEHRVKGEHQCTDRCRPHVCKPLSDSSIHQIHGILSGAIGYAIRWGWIAINPLDQARTPTSGTADPHPPTPEQAARIINAAWEDVDWGMLVWMAMVTGARRGEVCALAWDRLDFATGVLTIRSSIAQTGASTWEKHTKTHQQRRVTLDDQTLAILRAYLRRCRERAEALGIPLPEDARIFSAAPDGSTWLKPDSVGQRYTRMCERLGWDMNIHQLRHYSATELIAAGVDVRTVAGRLGHGGGGATTLRVYSAWVAEADQRAAGKLADHMPELPAGVDREGALTTPERDIDREKAAPYLRIAEDLRGAIRCGALKSGDQVPTIAELAQRYKVAASTAQRGIALLHDSGLVNVRRGQRAIIQISE